jgi:hypothetical protein
LHLENGSIKSFLNLPQPRILQDKVQSVKFLKMYKGQPDMLKQFNMNSNIEVNLGKSDV